VGAGSCEPQSLIDSSRYDSNNPALHTYFSNVCIVSNCFGIAFGNSPSASTDSFTFVFAPGTD
jgi:hypothetical protein